MVGSFPSVGSTVAVGGASSSARVLALYAMSSADFPSAFRALRSAPASSKQATTSSMPLLAAPIHPTSEMRSNVLEKCRDCACCIAIKCMFELNASATNISMFHNAVWKHTGVVSPCE